MKDKLFYHNYFTTNKKYLNIAQLCREVDCNKAQMTQFLKDTHHFECMSVEKLKAMFDIVQSIASY